MRPTRRTTLRQCSAFASGVTLLPSIGIRRGQLSKYETEIAYDPYEDVDWETVTAHKCEFHAHARGEMDEPADVIDLYHDLGYTVYNDSAQATDADDVAYYPWERLDERDEEWTQTRDPEAMDVVTFPVTELADVEHVNALFSTITVGDAEYDDLAGAVTAITERDAFYHPDDGGLAILAHPGRYYDDPDEDWDRYRDLFADVSRADGLLGIEALNKEWHDHRDTMDRYDDLRLLDNLLSAVAPERMIWGFAVDDPIEYERGVDYDQRWTTMFLDPSDFDPSSQATSQEAVIDAFRDGRTCYHERVPWDDGEEEPARVPVVSEIAVDRTAGTITITASEYDTIEWVSDGDVVGSGSTISLDEVVGSYVRAQLQYNDGEGETMTQAWGLAS